MTDSIGSGLNKLANSQNIGLNSNIYKKPPQYLEIGWKTYRIAGFIFFILSFAVMKYIVDYFKKTIDDKELINILRIVSFFFIINFGTFLFITIYYKYRKSVKGVKGPRGDRGIRGPQGKSNNCNICRKKTGGFKKEVKKTKMKEKVDNSSVILNFSEDPKKKPKWETISNYITVNTKKFIVLTPGYIGVGSDSVTDPSTYNTPKLLTKPEELRPIIGASAQYDPGSGQLLSLMYFYDRNRTHNPSKYRYKPDIDNIYGTKGKIGTSVEFRAPKNSAVYKVEVVHNGSNIRAVHFYCADIMTGKGVKVLDPLSNKLRKYAIIGLPTSRDDTSLSFDSISAGVFYDKSDSKKFYQCFLDIEGTTVIDNTKITSIGFSKACYYNRKINI